MITEKEIEQAAKEYAPNVSLDYSPPANQ